MLRRLALTGLLCILRARLAGDFVDTRLSFVFADDNILKGAGETSPNSPSARFGAGRQNTQFYDNFNTKFSGFETLSNLVLYKKMPAYFTGLTTEAAFTVLVLEQPSGSITLRDNSSYIRLNYTPPGWGEKESISLTGFPVDADRMRLGFAYRISWGGSGIFANRAFSNGVPGAKLQITRDRWYAFAGAKTGVVQNDIIREQETVYGALAGAGVDLTENLRLEANGGFFQKGLIPALATLGIEAPGELGRRERPGRVPRGCAGGHQRGLPALPQRPRGLSALLHPGAVPGRPELLGVRGGQLPHADPVGSGRVRHHRAAGRARRARCRPARSTTSCACTCWGSRATSPSCSSRCRASPPSRTSRTARSSKPEMFIAGGMDYHFPGIHFTPGFIVGVQQPASARTTQGLGGNNPPESLTAGAPWCSVT